MTISKEILLDNNERLIISKACNNDAEHIIAFLNRVGGETEFLTFGLGEFDVSLNEEIQIISNCLELNQRLMIVGKINDTIVSQLFLDRSNRTRLSHIGDIGISVGKAYRGHSIGTHMLSLAVGWSKANGLSKLQLQVRTDNHIAIKLYDKFGFTIEGTISRAMKINDAYFDDYLMGLNL
tara:strand:+ start:2949 stop:3488 length:540 start_codon:yes stop_codon:yes gene_type:complete